MRITVVVPFSRMENAGHVLANFARQRHAEKRLLFVANGAARSLLAVPGAFVCNSEASPAHARNAGLAWAREHGGGAVSFWDDDDYYGAPYLSEVAAALDGHPERVAVKPLRYARWDDGLYYYLGPQDAPTFGPLISGFAERLPDFPLVHLEDASYKPVLDAAGLDVYLLSPRHHVYSRTGDRTRQCDATQTQFLRAFGPAIRLGDVPDSAADSMREVEGEFVEVPTWEDIFRELETQAQSQTGDTPSSPKEAALS